LKSGFPHQSLSPRFRAVKEVLDRVLGRPAQAVDIGWPQYFDPALLDDNELARLKALLEKAQPNGDFR
jgi:hypothetical protein